MSNDVSLVFITPTDYCHLKNDTLNKIIKMPRFISIHRFTWADIAHVNISEITKVRFEMHCIFHSKTIFPRLRFTTIMHYSINAVLESFLPSYNHSKFKFVLHQYRYRSSTFSKYLRSLRIKNNASFSRSIKVTTYEDHLRFL